MENEVMNKLNVHSRLFLIVASALFIVLNLFISQCKYRVDLTSNALYSVSEVNEEIIRTADTEMLATLLLGEKLPASFKKLKSETEFLLANISSQNSLISYELFDPGSGNISQVNALRKLFAEKGVFPTNLRQQGKSQIKEQLIYPFVHFQSANKELFINILESRRPNETEQEAIYRSISALENKIAKAIYELSIPSERRVGFLAFDKLIDRGSYEFVSRLKRNYSAEILFPLELMSKKDSIAVCIISLENHKLSKQDLFHVDQYLMSGGNLIWLINEYGISEDSIAKYSTYIPNRYDQGISDYLFKNGVKLTGNWIQDLRASSIAQVIGEQGGQIQTELFSFPYHPVVQGSKSHPISRYLEEVNLHFPTILDTVATGLAIRKNALLTSSEYSKVIIYPHEFSFDFLRTPLDPNNYTEKQLIIAILLEGRFESYFINRLGIREKEILHKNNSQFLEQSVRAAKQIVVTDKDFLIPTINTQSRSVHIGYNKWERRIFEDNEKFILNAIEYMLNGSTFLENEQDGELVFAAIDKKIALEESGFWIIFNLLVPPFLLMVLFLAYRHYLKRKYAA